MKLQTLGKNQTKIIKNDKIIFFSYNTPIICFDGAAWFITDKKYSTTTTRHISRFIENEGISSYGMVPQDYIDFIAQQ